MTTFFSSFPRMFRFFRKHRQLVMVSLALCIAGMILFGIGGTSMMPSANDTVMKINGKKVSQHQYDLLFNQMQRTRQDMTAEQRKQLPQQALNELIRQEVFFQESKKYGIDVTDQELQLQLSSIPAFQKDGKFDASTYLRMVIQTFGMSIRDFEKFQKKDMAGRELNQLIASTVHVPETAFQQAYLAQLAMETDKTKKKELEANPEKFRQMLIDRETNLVFGDWLNQLNSTLKINFTSDLFRQRLEQPAK